jgi:hypothetical protein
MKHCSRQILSQAHWEEFETEPFTILAMTAIELAHISDRQFRVKQLEFSISLWAALFFIPTAGYFVLGFLGKGDLVNKDAYDILKDTGDTTAGNSRSSWNLEDSVFLYYLAHGGRSEERIQAVAGMHELRRGIMLPSVLELILRVTLPRVRTVPFQFASLGGVDCEETACNFWLYARYAGEHEGSDMFFFSIPPNITRPIMQSSGASPDYEVACLQTIHMTFGRFSGITLFWHDHSEYTEFEVGRQGPCQAKPIIEVHDAGEPLSFDVPPLEFTGIYYVSFALAIVGTFVLLHFLWHCWSVRFLLIKKAINQSGLTMGGRIVQRFQHET